ncbi:MAG: hypothetical protein PVF63_01415 [Gammaproteobacteria bacterium]|jgi:hypothetical protein
MLNPVITGRGTRLEGANERFVALNDPLILPTRSTLARIIATPGVHARLLNTLALLEHIGSYRIMVSQHGEQCAQPTLRHLAEEAQHAFFMKRQAEKVAGQPLGFAPGEVLAGDAARSYFRRLEALIHGRLARQGSAAATYLYMSMIIEFRALWFYSHYQQALKSAGSAISLKRILGEEANHLTDMTERLEAAGELSDARVDTFIAFEHRLYNRLLSALRT